MGFYVANRVIKHMIKKGQTIAGSRVLMLGITFKENCPDIRNSRAIDVIAEFNEYSCKVDVYDPWANPDEVKHEYGIDLIEKPDKEYDAVVLAVAHDEFKQLDIKALGNGRAVIYDIKGLLDKSLVDERL
jgi:UDP-N-acetyl-D-galactosamine dehydrogenase